jgi:chemotaxis regulatin CheY-phosphate phosphatase CheZ
MTRPFPNITPQIVFKPLEAKIYAQLETDYKKRLGVPVLPPDIVQAITSASKEAASRATTRNLEREASSVARTFFQVDKIDALIGNRLKAAKDGMASVTNSPDLGTIIAENAKLLRRKWQALVDAGFKEEQAFELIRAEVEGKAARRAA